MTKRHSADALKPLMGSDFERVRKTRARMRAEKENRGEYSGKDAALAAATHGCGAMCVRMDAVRYRVGSLTVR